MEFALEPIGEADFEFRYAVYEVAIKPYIDTLFGWEASQHREYLRANLAGSGNHFALVVDGERVGIVQIEEGEDRISLHQLEIMPAFQGRGIGTELVQSLIERAEESGKFVQLSVFNLNTRARQLYERLGFVVVSETERDVQMRFSPGARAPGRNQGRSE